MFYKVNNELNKKRHLMITSFNNTIINSAKKYSSSFISIDYSFENIFCYNYYFRIKIIDLALRKYEIHCIINEKNPVYYNKTNFFSENQIIGFSTIEEMSSNDIVSGLPKLNSLMENSFETENTKYLRSEFNINFDFRKDLTITDYNLFFIKKGENQLNKNKNKRENKDPELYSWLLFSDFKIKNSLVKSLTYSILKTKQTILNSLVQVYNEQNIKLHKKIFANVVNTMFNRIFIAESLSNPIMMNDKIYAKLYFKLVKLGKSLNFIPPIGLILVEGISKSVTSSPRLLNSISFRDTTNNLINYSLYQPKDWLTSIKSKLILGQRVDIGTYAHVKNKALENISKLTFNSSH